VTALDPETLLPRPVPAPDVELQARAIVVAGDIQKLTYTRETDARTALALGLKQYLETVSIIWSGGRELRFVEVHQTWADPETPAKYPSASLVGLTPAEYEGAQFTPQTVQVEDGSGRYIRMVSELQQVFALVIWCTDPEERNGLVAAVEDAMEPADFMTGLRLELPFYFNLRATYEKTEVDYDDSGEDNQRRWRRAIMTITANVPQARPVGDLANMKHQQRVDVVDGNAC